MIHVIEVRAAEQAAVEVTGPGIVVVELGSSGPSGPSAQGHVHEQMTPAAVWTITHNLGFRPGGVLVVEYGGANVEGEVDHASDNALTITFQWPVAGRAYLS